MAQDFFDGPLEFLASGKSGSQNTRETITYADGKPRDRKGRYVPKGGRSTQGPLQESGISLNKTFAQENAAQIDLGENVQAQIASWGARGNAVIKPKEVSLGVSGSLAVLSVEGSKNTSFGHVGGQVNLAQLEAEAQFTISDHEFKFGGSAGVSAVEVKGEVCATGRYGTGCLRGEGHAGAFRYEQQYGVGVNKKGRAYLSAKGGLSFIMGGALGVDVELDHQQIFNDVGEIYDQATDVAGIALKKGKEALSDLTSAKQPKPPLPIPKQPQMSFAPASVSGIHSGNIKELFESGGQSHPGMSFPGIPIDQAKKHVDSKKTGHHPASGSARVLRQFSEDFKKTDPQKILQDKLKESKKMFNPNQTPTQKIHFFLKQSDRMADTSTQLQEIVLLQRRNLEAAEGVKISNEKLYSVLRTNEEFQKKAQEHARMQEEYARGFENAKSIVQSTAAIAQLSGNPRTAQQIQAIGGAVIGVAQIVASMAGVMVLGPVGMVAAGLMVVTSLMSLKNKGDAGDGGIGMMREMLESMDAKLNQILFKQEELKYQIAALAAAQAFGFARVFEGQEYIISKLEDFFRGYRHDMDGLFSILQNTHQKLDRMHRLIEDQYTHGDEKDLRELYGSIFNSHFANLEENVKGYREKIVLYLNSRNIFSENARRALPLIPSFPDIDRSVQTLAEKIFGEDGDLPNSCPNFFLWLFSASAYHALLRRLYEPMGEGAHEKPRISYGELNDLKRFLDQGIKVRVLESKAREPHLVAQALHRHYQAMENVIKQLGILESQKIQELVLKINTDHAHQFNKYYLGEYNNELRRFEPSKLSATYYHYNRHAHGNYKSSYHENPNKLAFLNDNSLRSQTEVLSRERDFYLTRDSQNLERRFENAIQFFERSRVNRTHVCAYARPHASFPRGLPLPLPENFAQGIIDEILQEYTALNLGHFDCVYQLRDHQFFLEFYLQADFMQTPPVLLRSYSWNYRVNSSYSQEEAIFWWWFGGIYSQDNASIHTVERSPIARVVHAKNGFYEDIHARYSKEVADLISWGRGGSDTPNIMNTINYPKREYHPGVRHQLEEGKIPEAQIHLTKSQKQELIRQILDKKKSLYEEVINHLKQECSTKQNPDLAIAIAHLNQSFSELYALLGHGFRGIMLNIVDLFFNSNLPYNEAQLNAWLEIQRPDLASIVSKAYDTQSRFCFKRHFMRIVTYLFLIYEHKFNTKSHLNGFLADTIMILKQFYEDHKNYAAEGNKYYQSWVEDEIKDIDNEFILEHICRYPEDLQTYISKLIGKPYEIVRAKLEEIEARYTLLSITGSQASESTSLMKLCKNDRGLAKFGDLPVRFSFVKKPRAERNHELTMLEPLPLLPEESSPDPRVFFKMICELFGGDMLPMVNYVFGSGQASFTAPEEKQSPLGMHDGFRPPKEERRQRHTFTLDGEARVFEAEVVPGDGDCGFHALGVERDEVVETLLAYADQEEVRRAFIEEIEEALINNRSLSPQLMGLSGMEDARALRQEAYSSLEEYRRTSTEETDQATVERTLGLLQAQVNQADENYRNQLAARNVFETYIREGYGGAPRLWLSYVAIEYYARTKRINVHIFHEDGTAARHYTHEDAVATHYLLHTLGHAHFNRLHLLDSPAPAAEANAEPEERHYPSSSGMFGTQPSGARHQPRVYYQGYIRNVIAQNDDYFNFGISREEARNLLTKASRKDPKVQEILRDGSLKLLTSKTDRTEDFVRHLESRGVNIADLGREEYLSGPEMFTDFIDYSFSRVAGYSLASPPLAILQALAHIRKVGLRIWQLGRSEELRPHDLYRPQGGAAFPRIDLLWVDNRFEYLTFDGYESEFPSESDIVYPFMNDVKSKPQC